MTRIKVGLNVGKGRGAFFSVIVMHQVYFWQLSYINCRSSLKYLLDKARNPVIDKFHPPSKQECLCKHLQALYILFVYWADLWAPGMKAFILSTDIVASTSFSPGAVLQVIGRAIYAMDGKKCKQQSHQTSQAGLPI